MKISFLSGVALTALFLAPAALPANAAVADVLVGKPAATQSVDFVVHLPLRDEARLEQLTMLQGDRNSPLYHHFLTPVQFRAAFGPTALTIRAATAALAARGLAVTKAETQLLHVRGAAAKVETAFGTRLGVVRDARGRLRVAAPQAVIVPAELQRMGATVAGLSFTHRQRPFSKRVPLNRKSPRGNYWFTDLKQAYDYPSYEVANGSGVTIATVGVSDFNDADAKLYFQHERLGGFNTLAPQPALEHVVFPGGGPFDPNSGTSDEANLDVQQSGGSAPGATIIGVDVPDISGEPFLLGYSYLDETNAADIVSTSYGECELFYTAPYNGGVSQTGILQSYHQLFLQGNSQGITFVFSSGDFADTDCGPPGYLGAPTGTVFPSVPGPSIWADDPATTAVGGTNLVTTTIKHSLKSAYVNENAYSDKVLVPIDLYGTGNYTTNVRWGSGGGYSTIFKKPAYQNLVPTGSTSRRASPDVSMHMGGCPLFADPNPVDCGTNFLRSGDVAYVGGTAIGLIGTSASAPEFAGLLAVKESILKSRLGNENVDIYSLAAKNTTAQKYFHQSIPGNNAEFSLGGGQTPYDTILGVGTPIANTFVGLPDAALSGDPQTATNP